MTKSSLRLPRYRTVVYIDKSFGDRGRDIELYRMTGNRSERNRIEWNGMEIGHKSEWNKIEKRGKDE